MSMLLEQAAGALAPTFERELGGLEVSFPVENEVRYAAHQHALLFGR